MRRRILTVALGLAVLAAAGIGPAAARADGLPVLGIDVGPVGVLGSSGSRYVTIPAGPSTVVARVDSHGGRILGARLLRGTFTIPAVAYDGSAGGLSADGRTLVLIQPRVKFPRARTTLTVLDTRAMRRRTTVSLRGDFSYDAVSPRGSLLYLIQYVDPQDPTRYLVRAYDLRAGRLLAKPIVDPNEADEDMRGQPLTRATSPGGRWAYTLYDGAGMTPFVHALDTRDATARCIDLDLLAGRDLSVMQLNIRVGPRGETLTVRNGLEPLAVVDTRTFRARAPQVPRPPAAPAASHGTAIPWAPIGVALAAVMAALGGFSVAIRRRRHRLALVR